MTTATHWLASLRDHVATRPTHPALEWLGSAADPPQVTSYGDLGATVERAAATLRDLGVRPGDRVAILLSKSPAFVRLHLAVLSAGAVSLPLNPAATPDELAYFLRDAEASLLVIDPSTAHLVASLREASPWVIHLAADVLERPAPVVEPPPLPDPGATAVMIYTSGTTGRPKGAEITHANLTAQLGALHEAWGWRAGDRLLHALPLFHVHGLIVALHAALGAGATTLLLPAFDARTVLQSLATRNCTVFMGVPTMHRRLVDCPDATGDEMRGLRLVTSGSDRLPDDLFERFRQLFGQTLLERYGMTETGMLLSNPLDGERRVGSVGRPLPGVEVRVADPNTAAVLPDGVVGEVQVRGPNVFKGYWRQPDKTAAAFTADGWFRTGDLGLREPDGYLRLNGRAKDLIITGGYNVYPPEVERVLAAHPAVEACAVFGCLDDVWGEVVAAAVVLREDAAATPVELAAHCQTHLAAYKRPRRYAFPADLPRNTLGKVQKQVLRETYCAR